MSKILAVIAMITLTITLVSTVIAIWWRLEPREDLIRLTEILISWQVIAGGLIIGGAKTFKTEIQKLLNRAAKNSMHSDST